MIIECANVTAGEFTCVDQSNPRLTVKYKLRWISSSDYDAKAIRATSPFQVGFAMPFVKAPQLKAYCLSIRRVLARAQLRAAEAGAVEDVSSLKSTTPT